ncbi:hypothetical protein BDV41DRAFT_536942 [Aspergillus transmontanensis]|uniref:Uncharacterized protein n=1 Tax=Aspergillus transmontanensis TaxID=1034304 RepID=A0A5N6VXQ7_9EURO|nr:hypothetical protein BDV41DRAFT_536942 [Aspergillus transmontanensis]
MYAGQVFYYSYGAVTSVSMLGALFLSHLARSAAETAGFSLGYREDWAPLRRDRTMATDFHNQGRQKERLGAKICMLTP